MYKYNLQALLEHRKFIEDMLQKELSVAKIELNEEKSKLDSIQRKERDVSSTLKEIKKGKITSQDIIMHHNYLVRLNEELIELKKRVISVERLCVKKRAKVVEAMKNRRTLEKLKEKGMQAYTDKLLKKEQEFVNEIAVNRFNRNR